MEGVNFGSFFSYINMAGSAVYKAASKIGTLSQRVSSYIQSFFASSHSKADSEIEPTEVLKGKKVIAESAQVLTYTFNGRKGSLKTVFARDVTGRRSFESPRMVDYDIEGVFIPEIGKGTCLMRKPRGHVIL